MRVCKISVRSREALVQELKKIGAHAGSFPFFENKREILHLSVAALPCAAANVLKQEMLSAGGDAAVNAGAVSCSVPKSRVLLFGTRRQLLQVADKLRQMPWWDFPALADEISARCFEKEVCQKTKIMGIINLTEDSFFEQSRVAADAVLARARQLQQEGADILDIGAESTRPGADRVDEATELSRISFAVKQITCAIPNAAVSVDTTRVCVAKAALENGACMINDVSGLADSGIAKLCAEFGAKYVLMHTRGDAKTMDSCCDYEDILPEINNFFEERLSVAEAVGLKRENVILDPGFGFAKTAEQNRYLLKNICAFKSFGLPLLAAVSRKRFLGENLTPQDRLPATLAAAAFCVLQGVRYLRVHDVAENRRVADFCGVMR